MLCHDHICVKSIDLFVPYHEFALWSRRFENYTKTMGIFSCLFKKWFKFDRFSSIWMMSLEEVEEKKYSSNTINHWEQPLDITKILDKSNNKNRTICSINLYAVDIFIQICVMWYVRYEHTHAKKNQFADSTDLPLFHCFFPSISLSLSLSISLSHPVHSHFSVSVYLFIDPPYAANRPMTWFSILTSKSQLHKRWMIRFLL